MTPYEILSARHAKNSYKRGDYKGDAPMDKRAKNHFRSIEGENMVVRMYSTDILTAYRNGEFTIDLGGYSTSSTTKSNINHVLGVINQRMRIGTKVIMGVRQTVVRAGASIYLYYDGIRFNQAGELVTKPRPFEARRIDKDATKLLMDAVKESGFKAMYPVLYATAQAEDYEGATITARWRDHIQDADYAHYWPGLVLWWKFDKSWHLPTTGAHKYGVVEIGTAKTCWAHMMAKAKQDMYDTIRTEVTNLDV
ncbi:hypothetical protein UFOVP48_8 [uncultured Caudovirales phage]|uniref:Uncharacterized protein n=1 Tax=uncultured Caudovirales phage TaxID=2100421 RepID=A0A6J5KQC8_9CAUD|nr:hypothetical protein UFOVP48_8 [uncultured Caudovirales phage]